MHVSDDRHPRWFTLARSHFDLRSHAALCNQQQLYLDKIPFTSHQLKISVFSMTPYSLNHLMIYSYEKSLFDVLNFSGDFRRSYIPINFLYSSKRLNPYSTKVKISVKKSKTPFFNWSKKIHPSRI